MKEEEEMSKSKAISVAAARRKRMEIRRLRIQCSFSSITEPRLKDLRAVTRQQALDLSPLSERSVSSVDDSAAMDAEHEDMLAEVGDAGDDKCWGNGSTEDEGAYRKKQRTSVDFEADERDSTLRRRPELGRRSPDRELSGESNVSAQASLSKEASGACAHDRASDADRCPPHGVISLCGRRREMEDAVAVVPSFMSLPSWAIGSSTCTASGSGEFSAVHFFGVYDGHGGAQAALYCRNRLHKALIEEMQHISELPSNSDSTVAWDSQWTKALTASFLRVDKEMAGCYDMGCAAPITVGSTATVAVVGSHQIIVANCGDSRAVLSRGGQAMPLSTDHKPQRTDELARVEAAGGRVLYRNGYRVLGVLAMSRAIGDRYLKPYVIPDPEVTCTQRSEDDECLILASDGLWDTLSNEMVCEVARRCLAGWRSQACSDISDLNDECGESAASTAAAVLTKLALAKGSTDNISVVVVDLKSRRV